MEGHSPDTGFPARDRPQKLRSHKSFLTVLLINISYRKRTLSSIFGASAAPVQYKALLQTKQLFMFIAHQTVFELI